ncbi:MAG: SGNH/GDSL hydrolase family protein [Syntrophaceae bacterium]|nr:SGNH/GDSL hydrolase family protein [Syntrophaceae bacterium]
MNPSKNKFNEKKENLVFWKKFIFLIIPFFVLILFLECLLRFLGYEPKEPSLGKIKPSAVGYFNIADKKLGFRSLPNGIYRNTAVKIKPKITTDEFGYRNGYGWTSQSDRNNTTIVFVGDSTTFCAEVNDNETGPSEVAKILSKKYHVTVMNAGVIAFNTVQTKRMIQEILDRFPKVKFVVYTYCGNDYLENLNPIAYYPMMAPYIWWDKTHNKFIEHDVHAPSVPWGQKFTDIDTIWTTWTLPKQSMRQQITDFIRSKSAFFNFFFLRIRRIISNYYYPQQPLLQLPNGGAGPVWCGTAKWRQQVEWAKNNHAYYALAKLLREINTMCKKKGVIFLVTEFSTGSYIDKCTTLSGNDFAMLCKEAGVQYLNIQSYFTGNPFSYMAQNDTGYNTHYGTKGTKTYAAALAPKLEQLMNNPAASSGLSKGTAPQGAGN